MGYDLFPGLPKDTPRSWKVALAIAFVLVFVPGTAGQIAAGSNSWWVDVAIAVAVVGFVGVIAIVVLARRRAGVSWWRRSSE